MSFRIKLEKHFRSAIKEIKQSWNTKRQDESGDGPRRAESVRIRLLWHVS